MSQVSCQHCVDLLVDYLEGQLSADEEKRLDEHFRACPPCVDFVDQYRAATKLCKRAIAEEMPDALAEKLSEFLNRNCKS